MTSLSFSQARFRLGDTRTLFYRNSPFILAKAGRLWVQMAVEISAGAGAHAGLTTA